MCKCIRDLKETYKNGWYDIFIDNITRYLKQESRRVNQMQKEKINYLFYQLKSINSNSHNGDDSADYENMKENIKNEINKYYDSVRKGHEERVRDEKLKYTKQPKKILLEYEIKQNRSCKINAFETTNGQQIYDDDQIKREIFQYYNELLGKEHVDKSIIDSYEFKIKKMNINDY